MDELALAELIREVEFRRANGIDISSQLRQEVYALLPRDQFENHGTHLVPKRVWRVLLRQSR